MVNYKLTYFDAKAVGEPIRFLFAAAGVDYEDDRIKIQDWGEVKGKLGYGQLPILYIDGEQLTQSYAIMRYLATLFDLVPKDPFLAARCDELADSLNDVRQKFRDLATLLINNRQEEADKTAEVRQQLRDVHFPKFFAIFEEIVGKTSGTYIAGEKLSWADLLLASWLDLWETLVTGPGSEYLNDFPKIKKLRQTVFELPGIKAHVNQRPDTVVWFSRKTMGMILGFRLRIIFHVYAHYVNYIIHTYLLRFWIVETAFS